MAEAAVSQIRSTRVPTHNLDAEGAVISAVFLSPESFYDIAAVMGGTAFYSSANRWIWHAFEALEAEGTPIDVVTVSSWLRAREKLDAVGGTPYISQLIDQSPALANVVEHARIVAGCAHQRRLVAVLQSFAAEGYGDVGDPLEWGQRVEQGIYEAARLTRGADEDGSISAIVPLVIEAASAQRRGEQEAPGIMTGLDPLDERINGVKRAKVYVIAGRPGMGKTAFTGQIGTSIAERGMLVIEISTEQKRDELARRKLSQAASVAYSAIESGTMTAEEWDRVIAHGERLRRLPIVIEYMNAATISQIRGAIRRGLARLRKVHGNLPVGLISVDQIGQLNAEHVRGESRESEVSRLSRELSWMAGEFDAPMLVCAQLNRGVESRPDKRPLLSDLRESGAIEQDAYGVWFPFRPKYYDREKPPDGHPEDAEVIIAKDKNAGLGAVKSVFHGPSMTFTTPGDWTPGGKRQTRLPVHDSEEE